MDYYHDDDDDDYIEPETEPQKRGPGRPKGSKSRPKESLITKERLEVLYNRFQQYLTNDQKKYVKGVINGTEPLDTIYEMELLVRQMALLFQEAATYMFGQGKVTQDLAKFADSLRASIKDLNDMKRADEVRKEKETTNNDLVRITVGGSEMERLETFLSKHSS